MTVILLSILSPIMRSTAPVLLASVGSLYNDRSGVTNIVLEGTMLGSAFTGVVASYFTQSWIIGVIIAVITGLLISATFSLLTTILGGDELVIGFAANVLIDGLTIYLLKEIFQISGSIVSDKITGIPEMHFAFLENIPILNELLNNQTWIVYFAFLSLWITQMVIYHTPFGMRVIACGENPSAASTVGVNVNRIRFYCNLITGAMCGLAGAQISLGFLTMFSEGMVVGRGFIALAAVIFARGKPLRVLVITLFFGLADAISNQMQLIDIPREIILMIPYIAVIMLLLLRVDQFRKVKQHKSIEKDLK